jgi:biopolymer transport protein ExbD/biopolymer transport protein TolR
MWIAALVVLVSTMTAAQRSIAQSMQKGISVQLAPTSSAVPVPNADNDDALIITVSEAGKLYFGIDPVATASLAEKLMSGSARHTQNLYIKADARAPYGTVVKVLDAAHAAGVAGVTLITGQPKATPAGMVLPPEGIEIGLTRRSETK